MTERVLITGCTSCTGSHLVNHLRQQAEVRIWGTGLEDACDLELTYRACNATDGGAVAALVQEIQPTQVYHLAGATNERNPAQLMRTNVEGTIHLLEACRLLVHKPRILVIGSCAVYRDLSDSEAGAAETMPLNPSSAYAISRVAQADVCGLYESRHGLPVMMTRTFNLIGPGLASHLSPTAIAQRVLQCVATGSKRLSVYNGAAIRDFVDVRDAVVAYRLILEQGTPGAVYNVGSGRGTSIRELSELLVAQAKADVELVNEAPAGGGRSAIMRSIAEIGKLRTETGWEPTIPLTTSLNDLLSSLT